MQNFVEPIILAGNSNQRQCYRILKTSPKCFLLHFASKLIVCALSSKLTRINLTKIGQIQRNTFSQFFGLLFCYDQTVEMPASTIHVDKIFYTLFYRSSYCFGANSQFHHFFNVFNSLLRS